MVMYNLSLFRIDIGIFNKKELMKEMSKIINNRKDDGGYIQFNIERKYWNKMKAYVGMIVRDGREEGRITHIQDGTVQVVWRKGKSGRLLKKARIEHMPISFLSMR